SEMTILSEREGHLAERIQELENSLVRQNELQEAQGLAESDRVILPEQMKRLAIDLAAARRNRLEAEHRLVQTRKDLAAGLPVSALLSRLPNGDARDVLQKSLATPQLAEELRRDRVDFERLARTYGRKHPRMLELQRKIDDLQARADADEDRN